VPQGTCSVEGCPRTGKITYGYCQGHYKRWAKRGDPGPAEIGVRRAVRPGQTCAVDGCGRSDRIKRGWCETHYARWRATGDVQADQPVEEKFTYAGQACSAPDCDSPAFCRELCTKHYQRLVKTGTVAPRTPVGYRPCGVDDCAADQHARGYCINHLRRLVKYGDPLASRKQRSKKDLGLCAKMRCRDEVQDGSDRCPTHHAIRENFLRLCKESAETIEADLTQPVAERFFSLVDKTDGCWPWKGYTTRHGYGMFTVASNPTRSRPAHRVSWSLAGRPLKSGYHLDHLCRVRNCVNPDHLEQVTPAVNNFRGESPAAQNRRKTHCQHGHEFDLINTIYAKNGQRQCRACYLNKGRKQQRRATETAA
jgi:hypothetical protein